MYTRRKKWWFPQHIHVYAGKDCVGTWNHFFKHLFHYWGWDGLVGIVTRLRAKRNRGSTLGRGKRFILSSKRLNRPLGPPSLLFNGALTPRVTRTGCAAATHLYSVSRVRMELPLQLQLHFTLTYHHSGRLVCRCICITGMWLHF